MARRRAVIIGGSVGGLFAAHMLRQIGWDVEIFERAREDLMGRGAGIGAHEALYRLMRRIDMHLDQSTSTATDSYVCLFHDGTARHEIPKRRYMSSWARVYRPLRDKLPAGCYHAGKQLERIENDATGATALFTDGTRARGDIVIGADGFRSTVRNQFAPQIKPVYAGYLAWRTLTPEQDLPASVRDVIFHRYAFSVPKGETVISYPVPSRSGDSLPGLRDYNIVWYRPVSAERLADMCTDATGRHHELSIAPSLIRPDVIASVRAEATELLHPALADVVARTEQPFFQAIYDVISEKLAFTRTVLLGDAAFVARPHIGVGVTKAALDAAGLADAIAATGDDIDAALTVYDRERQKFANFAVDRARELGTWLGSMKEPDPELVMNQYIKTIERVRDASIEDTRDAPPRVS